MLDCSVLFAVDDESDGEYVVHTFERHLLLLHLLVDRKGSLCADLKLVVDALIDELLLERLDELLHQLLPVAFGALELVCDGSVLLRLGVTEVDVLHLALDVVKTELVGKRNVQHHCLQNLPLA